MSELRIKLFHRDYVSLQKRVFGMFWKEVAYTYLSSHDNDAEDAVRYLKMTYKSGLRAAKELEEAKKQVTEIKLNLD